ncbi:hypothetical protein C1H46_013826 [Malus baccata]|uniref:Uncharacterized protein n=1 Tax=Malus baccata TaxID=106549 RepID=A0A540MP96_MALBA|nr:hypothetical protein C1H46_013826 [Malus baccata]
MVDSIHDSTKSCMGEGTRKGKEKYIRKCVLRIKRYHCKRVLYFEDKSRADAYAELRFDIRGLVRSQCSAKFESWKMVPEELKKSMVYWDVDETDEKQRKYLDDLFKMHFQPWKFDVLQDAECGGVPNAPEEED